MQKPNLLFILTDQQSWKMMGCAGNPWVKTPHLDALAAEGVLFDHTFCTNPVCIPSRFSFMTGRYPSEIGMRCNSDLTNDPLPESILQGGLGHRLRGAGYETVYGGKEHLKGASAEAYGFEYICPNERDKLADTCVDWLKQPRGKPFCMVASFINPHDICYQAILACSDEREAGRWEANSPVEVKEMREASENPPGMADEEFFDSVCLPLPENHDPQSDEPEAVRDLLNRRDFRIRARESWGEREWRRHRWTYARLTERVDRQIGRLLEGLRESGLAEDTVVVFTSDHGDHDASHKLEHKTLLYEEATRVPLIIRDPRTTRPGTTDERLVCNGLDMYTTLCDYAGAAPPADLQGLSLMEPARGDAPGAWRDHVLTECENGYGIRTADHAYALYDTGKHREQLYDLRLDPGQTRNFAEEADRRDLLEHHRQRLESHLPRGRV